MGTCRTSLAEPKASRKCWADELGEKLGPGARRLSPVAHPPKCHDVVCQRRSRACGKREELARGCGCVHGPHRHPPGPRVPPRRAQAIQEFLDGDGLFVSDVINAGCVRQADRRLGRPHVIGHRDQLKQRPLAPHAEQPPTCEAPRRFDEKDTSPVDEPKTRWRDRNVPILPAAPVMRTVCGAWSLRLAAPARAFRCTAPCRPPSQRRGDRARLSRHTW